MLTHLATFTALKPPSCSLLAHETLPSLANQSPGYKVQQLAAAGKGSLPCQLLSHPPLGGVEAPGEGLHTQDAEDDNRHNAHGSIDAERGGQGLASDSCAPKQTTAAAAGVQQLAGNNIGSWGRDHAVWGPEDMRERW